jgi:predicted nucleic acid-binding Zn ribbon protein
MPTYTFENTDTNEVFDLMMTMSSREDYLKNNPHIKQLISAPKIVRDVGLSGVKTDSGFKEALSKVKAAHKINKIPSHLL